MSDLGKTQPELIVIVVSEFELFLTVIGRGALAPKAAGKNSPAHLANSSMKQP